MTERLRTTTAHGVCACGVLLGVLLLSAACAQAAEWQYSVPFERGADRNGKPNPPGKVFLWLPPQCQTLRGLFSTGRLGIEAELNHDPSVRAACHECAIGIMYFDPHISGTFNYWAPGSTDGARWLKALDDLAQRSGHPEVRRAPWITAGHSTAGIFCRNVAYWKPDRVAAVVHVKSGNFHQKDTVPPSGSLVGVPLVAVNGQFETYGPEGGLRPEYGRETQWVFVRKDLQEFRAQDPNYLLSNLVQWGDDHFHGAPELSGYVALFLRKTAQYRLPQSLPPGDDPVKVLPLKAEDGWLTDPDLYHPTHPAAPYAQYTGDKAQAMWHYDQEMAQANQQFDKNMAKHQALDNPTCAWLDDGDGWTFKAVSKFLDTMPDKYAGSLGGRPVGHSATPFVYRCKATEPVVQLGPDTFRLLRNAKAVNLAAFHPGDDQYRATIRWGSLNFPDLKGAAKQTLEFPAVPDLKADAEPYELKAKATSGLPVYYEVDYGPVAVVEGKLKVAEVPANPQFPIECRVTAYQIGRRTAPLTAPADPVSVVFRVTKP